MLVPPKESGSLCFLNIGNCTFKSISLDPNISMDGGALEAGGRLQWIGMQWKNQVVLQGQTIKL